MNIRLAKPRVVVIRSAPVAAPIGTVVVMTVGEIIRIAAANPLKLTVVAPGSKFTPVIVTSVPIVPPDGETSAIDGPKRTLKVRAAGVGSSLPARSRAFTSKVCAPSVRPESAAVVASLNAVHAPPSSRQPNARPPAGVRLSMPVNEKVAMATAISPLGPLVIVVSGGVLSMMTTRVAVRGLPARSVALAPSVWLPSATVEVSQAAAIESGEAGGAGVRVATRGCPSTVRPRLATPLASVACAWTSAVRRTCAFAGGVVKSSAGGVASWVTVTSVGADVSPSPP